MSAIDVRVSESTEYKVQTPVFDQRICAIFELDNYEMLYLYA